MNRTVLILSAALLIATGASANSVLTPLSAMPTDELQSLWKTADATCNADVTGNIIKACLVRTDVTDLLEKRGLCRDASYNRTGWVKCLVGESGGGASGSAYLADPVNQKTNRHNTAIINSFSEGTRGAHGAVDVSPIQ